MFNIFKSSVALAISLALSACGGSGGESTVKEPANIAPQIANIDTQSVKEGQVATISAIATDSDGIVSNYVWSQTNGVPVELSGTDSNEVTFSVPTIEQDEVITLIVTATDDDGATATKEVIVNLSNNLLPTIVMIEAQSVDEKTSLSLVAEIADEDGEISSITWQQVSGKTLTLTNADSATVTIDAPQIKQGEVAQLKLTIVDDTGDIAEQLVGFTLNNTHHNIKVTGNANVNGKVLIAADIEFSIKDQTFTATTDENGDYSLNVDVDVNNEFYNYKLSAQGIDAQSHIVLAKTELLQDLLEKSNLANAEVQSVQNKYSAQNVQASAVKRTVNNIDEMTTTDTDIDAITASEYEYLHSFFDNKTDLLALEYLDSKEFKKKHKHIDPELMLKIATAFSYAAENDQSVDKTNGMASLQAYLVAILGDEVKKIAFDSLLDNQVANVKTKASDIFETDKTYYATLASNPGTIRLGIGFNKTYRFNSDNSYIEQNEGEKNAAAWVVDGKSLVVDTSDWAPEVIENQWLADEQVYADCTYTPISKVFNVLSAKFKSVQQFTQTINEHGYCVNDSGIIADEDYSYRQHVIGYTADDMEEWQTTDLENETIVFDHYSDTVLALNGVDDDTQAMSYQFNVDGSGIVVEDSANFSWEIQENGQLLITFSDYTIRWLKMYDDRSDNHSGKAIFAVYTKGDTTFVYQNMGVTDENETLVASDFMGKWDHGFNLSEPTNEVMRTKFYFEFLEGGVGTVNWADVTGTELIWSTPSLWYEEDGKLFIARTYTWDENGWGGRTNCDPRTDTSCYYEQFRTWEVLSQHGKRVYVKETLHFENRSTIVGRGSPSSKEDLPFTIRTNFYAPPKGE